MAPGHVRESAREFYAAGCVLRMKRVCVLNDQVGVEQFVRIFVRVGSGRVGAAEMNRVLVARNNGVDRGVLPCAPAFKAKLVFVIGQRGGPW